MQEIIVVHYEVIKPDREKAVTGTSSMHSFFFREPVVGGNRWVQHVNPSSSKAWKA
jgi:hypothetical protein